MKVEIEIATPTPRVMAALTQLIEEVRRSEVPAMLETQAPATERTVAAIVPETPPEAAGEVPEVDADGVAWDARIHSSGKTLMKNGRWTRKRGVTDEEVAAVRGGEAPAAPPPPKAPVAPPPPAKVAAAPPPPKASVDADLEKILEGW